jgi:uncharacterized radical SAM superfamily Fe-S cluster-containing enzyme
MARPFPVAVRIAPARPAETLESRLLELARPLKAMAPADVRRHFGLPPERALLKTTLSVCPECLAHVPAAVYVEEGRVLMAKHCALHGTARAVIENDERYYRLSNKDRWGRAYDLARMTHVPAYDSGCCGEGESCGTPAAGGALVDLATLTDQRGNKSCTVLVEITDACNLACRVCYADAKGDRILTLEQFKRSVAELVALKNGLDSVQVTGGEAALHPQFWEMLDFLHAEPRIAKIYLPTNGAAFDRDGAAEKLARYRAKLLVLLQFDGSDAVANRTLRRARPERVRERLLARLEQLDVPMQLTMTLAAGVNEREIAWVVRQGVRHRNVRLVALQPAFFAGRYEIASDPMNRATLSDAVKGVEAGLASATRSGDFMPIPCSHPNCGWVTLYARRFGLFFNLARHVDLARVMGKVAYRTQLGASEVRGIVGTRAAGWIARTAASIGRRFMRPRDVFGIAIKPFMDRYTYDQDRVSACCHHILDTKGRLASFCEYNVLHRAGDSWSGRPALQREAAGD